MFKSNTLFVIGAGASFEAGMPLGSDLTAHIAQLLDLHVDFGRRITKGDHAIYEALRKLVENHGWGDNDFLRSSRSVAEAMQLALSIDTFLESHSGNREYVQIGKLGIVRAISKAEAASKLKPVKALSEPFRLNDLSDTWYFSLARQLFTGIPADSPERAFQNVSFVNFNYDRCLETFLGRAAEVYFRLTPQRASALMKGVRIIHPYGSLGSVFEGAENHLPFASQNIDLLATAQKIRTFSEQSEVAAEISQAVHRADTIIFLGFGFHDQNLSLLEVASDYGIDDPPPKQVFATTMKLSPSDEAVVTAQISYALWGQPQPINELASISTNNGTCSDLFADYWRSLTR